MFAPQHNNAARNKVPLSWKDYWTCRGYISLTVESVRFHILDVWTEIMAWQIQRPAYNCLHNE